MKTAALLVAGATIALAKPHGHAHHHHKREPEAVTVVSQSVATVFELNGQLVSEAEVCQGISDGSLKFANGAPANLCASASSVSLPAPATTSASSSLEVNAAQFYQASTTEAAAVTTSQAASSTAAASPAASPSSSSSSSGSSQSSSNGVLGDVVSFVASLAQDDYDDFPDGELDCSAGVPTKYGAIPLDYLNRDGWAGIQMLNSAKNSIVSDSQSCVSGGSCSYSCAPGYQSLQWVDDQPANGASVGGLLCQGGKLYKANSNSKLCGKGVGGVTVENQASSKISVCRTNYPGLEDQTIPVDVASGDSQPLTCPDQTTYYQHQGKPTSAQYYLNPIGVGATSGCSWDGLGDGETGNWAPINLGVGASSGVKWLSIFQNAPTTKAVFRGTVNITGEGISGFCSYEPTADGSDGQYCGSAGCQKVSSGTNAGCTVSVTGNAKFVVSH